LPDIEQRFYQTYKDQGLVVVALNAHDTVDDIAQVQQFVDNLGVTFDIGIEETETYTSLVQNFAGLNPFPVDVLIDKKGMIRYVSREYDPYAIDELIQQLLAEAD
jgi:hypothetical protein